jgi:hypothetical protein
METEVSLRKRLDGLAESSRYGSAEFWASGSGSREETIPASSDRGSSCTVATLDAASPPVAPIETSSPSNAKVSHRVCTLYADENDPPELSQYTDLSRSQRSFGSGRKLITGIAVLLALGLSALASFFLASPSEKTTTQTAELAPSVAYPPATPAKAIPSVAPDAANPSVEPATADSSAAPVAATPVVARAGRTAGAAPAPATASAATAAADLPPWANSEPVQAPPKVAQSGTVLYLQRPGVNIRSTPSPTGSAVGTAPKGTRFKVTNRQGDWIQVERGRLKGWINAGFLAPSEPR